MRVKPYIPSSSSVGDLQGDDYEVPEEALESQAKFNEFKQSVIQDFVDKFDDAFEDKYGFPPDRFGVGTYKDNKKNRSLGRVGMSYDRGRGIRNYYQEQIRNGNIIIPTPMEVGRITPHEVPEIYESRPWTQQDILYLDQMMERGVPAPQIAERLMRTTGAVYSKSSRLRR